MIFSVAACVLFIIAALPLKNWLELRGIKAQDVKWSAWLLEKPSLKEYCLKTNQGIGNVKCDYCKASRQVPNLLMTIPHKPEFGIISNKIHKISYFKTYLCSKCGTHLYRERYEE